MKILVYRRDHTGDPNNETKTFGINDCMGSKRDWEYDAVIGIGGLKPSCIGIKEKITWVGITPTSRNDATKDDIERMKAHNPAFKGFRGRLVTFKKFCSWDEDGKPVKDHYPRLYQYMFEEGKAPRAAKNFPEDVYAELREIVNMAEREFDTTHASQFAARTGMAKNAACASSGKKHSGCA